MFYAALLIIQALCILGALCFCAFIKNTLSSEPEEHPDLRNCPFLYGMLYSIFSVLNHPVCLLLIWAEHTAVIFLAVPDHSALDFLMYLLSFFTWSFFCASSFYIVPALRHTGDYTIHGIWQCISRGIRMTAKIIFRYA